MRGLEVQAVQASNSRGACPPHLSPLPRWGEREGEGGLRGAGIGEKGADLPCSCDRMKKSRQKKAFQYTVLFEPAEEGGYVVTCPALPGLVTEGDSLEEARRMAKAAIRAYLESLRKDGLRIPGDKTIRLNPVKEKLRVTFEAA